MFLEFAWNAWEKRKLLEISKTYSGLTYHPEDIRESGTFVIRSSNVQNGSIVTADDVYVSPDIVNSSNVLKGDVIVVVRNGSRNLIGKHALMIRDMPNTVIGAFMTGIRSAHGPFINALLSTKDFQSEVRKSLGATINQITIRDFKLMSFAVPNSQEVNSIGAIFGMLDNLIAATQHKIDALEQVKETLSKNLFDQLWRFKEYSTSWKENKLKDIVSAYSGGTPSANIRTYYGGHIPFIRSAEIHSSTTALTLTQEGLKNSSAKLVKTGDILYALYGANSGDVDRSKINGAINQAILAMRPSKENDSNFILFQLMRMKNKIVSTYLQGGQGNLSGRIILALNLDMPESTSEQRTIGRSLQLLCELISINQSKYSQLESLKKSLLQNLFV
ncbi:restriction endonuclease subunit S [Lacticaseibacillus paracasei]|uniref:restriction endonuclease subunit S n=2 Tax=Lactobacillaceae TaxID=33958 RepID=UPI00345D09AB